MEIIKETKILMPTELKIAADLLQSGQLVAFPTETVYGLGADALNSEAVSNIFAAKGRPVDNPLIVHIAEFDALESLITGQLPTAAQQLIEEFWPGPLTVVLPKHDRVPAVTTGGLETIAVRMPAHPLAQQLIAQAEMPVAAPSANLSGRPSPTLAQHVIDDLAGRIEAVVDGGQTGIGVESTVVDCSQEVPTLLRPGNVTYGELKKVLGQVEVDDGVAAEMTTDQPLAPGMKYKHYSPQTEVILVEGTADQIADKIKQLIANQEEKLGIMATSEHVGHYKNCLVKDMGSRDDLREISNHIFKLLREFDRADVNKIVVEGVSDSGLGLAIMNRLRKAAERII